MSDGLTEAEETAILARARAMATDFANELLREVGRGKFSSSDMFLTLEMTLSLLVGEKETDEALHYIQFLADSSKARVVKYHTGNGIQ